MKDPVPDNAFTVSVVIPAWNAERHIGRAIRSVLAQTRPAGEIIVVDDGSTDGTAEAVRAFGDGVRLITQPNAGVSVARNTGIAAARGDWIAFLDADDEWMAEKLKMQCDCHRQYPDLKWSFTRLEWAHPEWPSHRLAHPDTTSDLYRFDDYLNAYCREYYAWTGTIIVHRSVFDAVGLFEPGMKRAQDTDMWFRIAYQFPQVGYVRRSLAVYHLDTPGSSTKINDKVDSMVALIERHRTLSNQFDRSEAFWPCAVKMLQVRIRRLLKEKRKTDARAVLECYRNDLPPRFVRETTLRLQIPYILQRGMDCYLKFKNKIRGRL